MLNQNPEQIARENFKQDIKSLINERKQKYKNTDDSIDIGEITATYNREKETTNGYNGRQLLELIQNADDAQSTEILIKLNTEKCSLIIANKGEDCQGFSVDGVKSLLLANLSSKTSNKYIGNKGLGFRAIINWSNKITINSNNLDITFSQDIAKNNFKNSGSINLPILALPELQNNIQNEWNTKISINYKDEFLDDIKGQIKELTPEILLFLNNLETITIDIDDEKQDIRKPTNEWNIELKQDDFPNELLEDNDKDTKYELKIAYNENLANPDNQNLFSYFPTNIKIAMPFIVHGTFDLDATRNQLNKTEKNRYVLRELVALIIYTAKELSKNSIDYKALSFLNYSHKNEVLEGLGFYQEIDLAISELEIYPCLGGDYRKKEDILYSNNFSQFVNTDDYRDLFSYLLIPTDNENVINILDNQELDNFNYYNNNPKDLKSLNKIILNIKDRTEFIHLLIENDLKGCLPLLIDNDNKLISLDDDVYTPATATAKFSLPNFVKIKFISQEFFNKLIEKFEITDDKARELQRTLKDITNIHSYEPAPVLEKIITQSNKEVKNNPKNVQEIIITMVQSLYKNYQILNSTPTISDNIKIQLISKNNTLSKARDLYLSKSYPSGELTEFLFSEVFKDSEFLANTSEYNFQNEDLEKVEQFFLWLGVNKISKLMPALFSDKKKYCELLFSVVPGKPDYADHMELQGLVNTIYNFDGIAKNISLEKFVLWCIKDENISENFGKKQSVNLLGSRGGYINTRYCDTSYIQYQLFVLNLVKDYLIGDEKINALINNKFFDFNYEKFKEFEISKYDVENMLEKVGAVDNFNELSINAVSRIIQDLPSKSKNGKQSETIYKLCLKHFEKNKEPLIFGKYKVFATKNNQDSYFDINEVFYNGSIKLPKNITQSKAIFKYPKRQNTENIIKFFGLQDLKSIKIDVINSVEIENKTVEFNVIFEKIKPYILAYRINKIETEENKRKEVDKLNKIKIKLCENIKYQADGEEFILAKNDYTKDGEKYLIEIDKNIDLNFLKSDFDFQEAFADIIGLEFGIVETQNFGKMLNEKIEYIEKETQTYLGNDVAIESKELLGISDEFNSFWKAIYKLKKLEYSDKLKEDFKQIQSDLGFSEKYEIDYDNLLNCENIILLFEKLEITIQGFNKIAYYKIDCSDYHTKKLEDYFNDNYSEFKQNLHKNCIKKSIEGKYLGLLNEYNSSGAKQDFKELLTVNYAEKYKDFILAKFDFKLSGDIENIDIQSIYDSNEEEYKSQFLPDEIESLLYFKDTEEEIKDWINKENSSNSEEAVKKVIPNEITLPFVDKKLTSLPPTDSNNNPKISGRYNPNQDKNNKEKGDKSEQQVFNSLVEEFDKENVIWESKTNDAAGYDIKYKNKINNWIFVEVKTYSNGVFYLSKNEKDFAVKNKDNYEIHLVSDEKIYKINPVDFSTLNLTATNFKIKYQLIEKSND